MAPPYGPATSPQQIDLPAGPLDAPGAWAVSLGVAAALGALAWRLRHRPALAATLASFAQLAAVTAPMLGFVTRGVIGDYPTIDKQGSLLFYLAGVHERVTFGLGHLGDDPMARLIGVHVGHLWVTAAFDLVMSPFAAMNAQTMLWIGLAQLGAWAWLRRWGDDRVAFVLAVPFGLGLHLFRDANWYTVEKTAVWVLPAYAAAWWDAARGDRRAAAVAAAIAAGSAFLNLYFAQVIALSAAVATAALAAQAGAFDAAARRRAAATLGGSYALTLLLAAPLVVAQAQLLDPQRTLADPDCFLRARAALDVVSPWPPAWNRLEAWRAIHPLGVFAALVGIPRAVREVEGRVALAVAMVAFAWSLGPWPLGAWNPVYFAAWYGVPFFWRIAKPEVFLFVAQLAGLAIAARTWSAARPSGRALAAVWAVSIALWFGLVRAHPAYPGFTAYKEAKLAAGWEERLGKAPECR